MAEKKITKIVIVGITGRMGAELRSAVVRFTERGTPIAVIGGIAAASDPLCGTELSGVNTPILSSWDDSFSDADVIIDFSSQDGARLACEAALASSIPLLECSTGLDEETEELVRTTASQVPVIRTNNTSVGVTVMTKLVAEAARLLDERYEIELVELHHKFKRDSPSGTAFQLLEGAAQSRGVELASVLSKGRSGTELSRTPQEIGAQAVRGGDVAGEHTVYFFGDGERIELTHRATSRSVFADGALTAALWLREQSQRGVSNGLYSMIDVLQ
jgi:4-hydroxy-tetrahydrodipicolinate reductase